MLIAILIATPVFAESLLDDISLIRRLGLEEKKAEKADRTDEIRQALIEIQKPDVTASQLRTHSRTLLAQDEKTVRRLLSIIIRDFRADRSSYLDRFHNAAFRIIKSRRTRGTEQEIETLRARILSMPEGGLTKEEIITIGDPSLQRLGDLLTVSRDAVFSADAGLRTSRNALLELISIWQRAHAKLPGDARKELPSPPNSSTFEPELRRMEDLAAYIATPMDAASREVMESNFKIAHRVGPGEADGTLQLNIIRIQLGLNALSLDLKLTNAARDHSSDMEKHKFFSHTSPLPGKTTPWDRAKLHGTTGSAENIFMGINSADAAIRGWWHSPGHHINMLGKHRRVALGRSGKYWTQMFGRGATRPDPSIFSQRDK